MRNSTACCDFARDDREGYVTAELRIAEKYPKPKNEWKETVIKMVWEMDIEEVYKQHIECHEKLRKTRNDQRRRELEFIEMQLSNRILWG
jgi:hypothetical protein